MGVGDKYVDNIAFICIGTKLWQELREVRVGHALNRLLRVFPRLIQFLNDLGLIGGRFLKGFPIVSRRRRGSHQSQNAVAFTGEVKKDYGKGARILRRAPSEFVLR